MSIRYTHILAFFVFLIASPLMGQEYIRTLSADYSNEENGIIIRWSTTNEAGVEKFQVERCVDDGKFHPVEGGVVWAKGSPSDYKLLDDSDMLRKPTGDAISGRVYTYRIRIVFTDNSTSLTETIEVDSPAISSTHHTWGTIKAMFK